MKQAFKISDELPVVTEKRNAARRSGDMKLFVGLSAINDDLVRLESEGFIYAEVDENGVVSGIQS